MRYLLAAALLATLAAAAHAQPENLAPAARVSASSAYGDAYSGRGAVDGVIPELMSKDDAGHAWAVRGETANDSGRFALEWERPVAVAEVIYYGRTSWLVEECWKDYEVRLDDEPEPVARGRLEMNAGPQRIALQSRRVRRLTLDFLSSHGGPNPGAAEIEVYSASPPEDALPRLQRLPTNWARRARVWDSSEYAHMHRAELAKPLRTDVMGFGFQRPVISCGATYAA